MSTNAQFDPDQDRWRYEALLEMTDLLLRPQSLPDLFVAMAERLRPVAAAEAASFSLHDPQKNVMCLHVWDGRQLASLELPVQESPSGWAWQRQEPLVVPDVSKDFRFPLERDILRDKGLDSYCCLPLSTAEKRLGAIGFGSGRVNAYSEKDVHFLMRVAAFVAVAVENARTREVLAQEQEKLRILLEMNNTLVTTRDPEKLFPAVSDFIQKLIHYDYASMAVYDEAAHSLVLYPLEYALAGKLAPPGATVPVKDTPAGHALMERQAKIFSREDLLGIQSSFVSQLLEHGVQSLCCIPLITRKGELGTLNLASQQAGAFTPSDVELLEQVAAQVAIALENA